VQRLLLLSLLVVAAAACGGGGPSISVGELPRLVLRPADVGSTFDRFDYGRQHIADAQPPVRSDPGRYGRLGGWIARYRRNAKRGLLTLESRADVFKDPGGARHDLDAYATLLRGAGTAPRAKHPPLGRLGDRAVALLFDQGSAAAGLRTVELAWQEGNATASITAQGFSRSTTLGSVLRLARLQDRLLRAAER
jgi:hypothetical protein